MSGANVGRVTSFADNVGVNELTDLCLIEILHLHDIVKELNSDEQRTPRVTKTPYPSHRGDQAGVIPATTDSNRGYAPIGTTIPISDRRFANASMQLGPEALKTE